jgi:hypothetical protein
MDDDGNAMPAQAGAGTTSKRNSDIREAGERDYFVFG